MSTECACQEQIATLLGSNDYEGAASALLQRLGDSGFNERYEAAYAEVRDIEGGVKYLPRITDQCVITTNFDGVLERLFHFNHIISGRDADAFCRLLADGEPTLLKLHGNFFPVTGRILTTAEYADAYGAAVKVDLSKPLPRALRRVFSHYSMLFVGCSMGADRTQAVFDAIVADEAAGYLPRHYAIVEWTGDERRETELGNRHIFPIWYPQGQHQHVEYLLRYVAEEG
jgi:hypothetical protein